MVRPVPEVRERQRLDHVFEDLVREGVEPWLADLVAKRVEKSVSVEVLFQPSVANIDDPICIPDMDKAVDRIVEAIEEGERCILAVDHDLDGISAASVLWSALVDHFGVDPNNLSVVTSHRLTEGYGITEPVVERILETDATLVISADKGSSDQERIKKIAKAGKDVVVTDHHAVPVEGPPASAFAVVNPARLDSKYDPFVCGAGVAFLTMAKVRTRLLEKNYRPTIPSLVDIIDYVAVATISDCVALRPDKSYINRAMVKRGLALINSEKRACWKVFRQEIGTDVCSEHIAFNLAPTVAAAGRLDWADAGFHFLVAKDIKSARKQWNLLKEENSLRKDIERGVRRKAFAAAREIEGNSIVVYVDDGHSGVHGITASKVVEAYGKPAAIFSPKGAGARNGDQNGVTGKDGRALASGSFRGIDGIHVREALQHVADNHKGLLVGFGGHAGAAGATLSIDDIEQFSVAYEEAISLQVGDRFLRPILWVDGDLDASNLILETVDKLMALEPWGKDFPYPSFRGQFTVLDVKRVGDGSHLQLKLRMDGKMYKAIWFFAVDEDSMEMPVKVGDDNTFVYMLSENVFRGNRTLQLKVLGIAE